MLRMALGAAILMAAVWSSGESAAAQSPSLTDIEYARTGDVPLVLDLYLPKERRDGQLLVWLHGGAWEYGSRRDMPLGALVERGYAIASVEFQPASAARFPEQIHEIKAAIRYLRARAAEYGYDAERIAVLGASSGGHLAALVATTNGDAALEGSLGAYAGVSSAVQAGVSFFGASNLTTILSQSTPFGLRVREPALQRLLGGLPDAVPELARLASPVFHVDGSDPPLLLLHGDQDRQMPVNQALELDAVYRQHGLDVKLVVVHGAGHGAPAFFDASHLELVADFLARHLGSGSGSGSS